MYIYTINQIIIFILLLLFDINYQNYVQDKNSSQGEWL